jgi:PHD/YefM family antitoxin component YafN of YafNO toxin-antitoxin module
MYGVKYELDEMMSASSFSRNMNKVSELLEKMKRVVVLRNNKPEMVVLPIEEYEFMKSLADLVEHQDIAKMIEKRKSEETTTLDELIAKNGLTRGE